MSQIRILILDDHPVVRRGLKSLLSNYADFDVVADVENVTSGMQSILALNPDVVLLDIRLPGESGLDLLSWIQEEKIPVKVVILTSFDDDELVLEALRRGAHGFILKSVSDEMLCDAIRAVYRNGRVLSPQVILQLVQQASDSNIEDETDESKFTQEELTILSMLVGGASNDEIAAELFMSVASVKRRLQKIFSKLKVSNRSLAIAETVRRNLLE